MLIRDLEKSCSFVLILTTSLRNFVHFSFSQHAASEVSGLGLFATGSEATGPGPQRSTSDLKLYFGKMDSDQIRDQVTLDFGEITRIAK